MRMYSRHIISESKEQVVSSSASARAPSRQVVTVHCSNCPHQTRGVGLACEDAQHDRFQGCCHLCKVAALGRPRPAAYRLPSQTEIAPRSYCSPVLPKVRAVNMRAAVKRFKGEPVSPASPPPENQAHRQRVQEQLSSNRASELQATGPWGG